MGKQMRLDKFLVEIGVGTRSQIKEMAKRGRIEINGLLEKKTETKIDPDKDTITCDGVKIIYTKMEYYMLNKPQGVVSATEDKIHRTVLDLIMDYDAKFDIGEERQQKRNDLFPVGRLDMDTEGLLLITNDGELAHNLLSPRRHVDKKYYAKSCEYPETNEGSARLYPYSREALETLVSLGTEENSVFYWYDSFLFPEEEQGVYLMLNVWDPESGEQ